MSLRLRLLLALVGLVAVGLLVADGVTYLSLQSFLLNRVDQQLEAARLPVIHALEIELGASRRRPGAVSGEAPCRPAPTAA